MSRLEHESDVDVLRQATKILDRENQKLTQKVVELTRENLSLKGQDPKTLQQRIADLEQQLAMARERQFGESSEKRSRADAQKTKEKRTGHGPREQQELKIVDAVHDLDDADKVCTSCGGALEAMKGQFEESDEVDVLERRFVLRRHKRKKYRCRCGACIETAPLPPKLFDGARYSIDFAIEVATGKYLDHLPLERQVRIMRREGLVVDSQTLWDQIERLARLLKDSYTSVRSHVLSRLVIGADETRWRLMGATGRDEAKPLDGRSGPPVPMMPSSTRSRTVARRTPQKRFSSTTAESSSATATARTALFKNDRIASRLRTAGRTYDESSSSAKTSSPSAAPRSSR